MPGFGVPSHTGARGFKCFTWSVSRSKAFKNFFYEGSYLISKKISFAYHSEKPYPHKIFFAFWERVIFSPTFLFEIGDNMLSCNLARFWSEKPYDFLNTGFMVPNSPVAHSVRGGALEFIQPEMNIFKSLAE
jgi:hypothetical protein